MKKLKFSSYMRRREAGETPCDLGSTVSLPACASAAPLPSQTELLREHTTAQGSIFGPILFTIFMSNLDGGAEHSSAGLQIIQNWGVEMGMLLFRWSWAGWREGEAGEKAEKNLMEFNEEKQSLVTGEE